jgi:hypothetical protein
VQLELSGEEPLRTPTPPTPTTTTPTPPTPTITTPTPSTPTTTTNVLLKGNAI